MAIASLHGGAAGVFNGTVNFFAPMLPLVRRPSLIAGFVIVMAAAITAVNIWRGDGDKGEATPPVAQSSAAVAPRQPSKKPNRPALSGGLPATHAAPPSRSSTKVSTTPSTPPATTRPTATLGPFESPGTPVGPEPGVEQDRNVTLSTEPGQDSVGIDYWRQEHEGGGDLHLKPDFLVTGSGAVLAVVPTADWATCSTAHPGQTKIPYSALAVGTQLCADSTEGRHARLKVLSAPTAADQRLVFYGYTWDFT